MRAVLLNTGTELLLGDVQDAHLSFIAREIFAFGLRLDEQRTVPDGEPIRAALRELFSRAEILFVTGGLGPTSDDVTRDIVAELLGLELIENDDLLNSLKERLAVRKIKWVASIARQAQVPVGAQVLANNNGSAPGLYLKANINPKISSPHLFVLPGPPRELRPMFHESVLPILRSIVTQPAIERKLYKITGVGESTVEEMIGAKVLAIPGIELGYCARPSEVDVRVVGSPAATKAADAIIQRELGSRIFSVNDENLEELLVKLLAARRETLAIAESCTGGLLANRITNVPGASEIFVAGYITYANEAKIDILRVGSELIDKHGAVSEQVARAMAEGARARAAASYALSTTGIAGPGGGSAEKPAGTVYVGLAAANQTLLKKFFFPNDRETFKQQTAQAAFDMLRRTLLR
jgi:nicotinamide-nucleotide amidase